MPAMDEDRSGTITIDEFEEGLKGLGFDLRKASFRVLFNAIDQDHNATLLETAIEAAKAMQPPYDDAIDGQTELAVVERNLRFVREASLLDHATCFVVCCAPYLCAYSRTMSVTGSQEPTTGLGPL